MDRGVVSPNNEEEPRTRRFQNQVAAVLNDLAAQGQLVKTAAGWSLASASLTSSGVLESRSFLFTPRYGVWG